MREQKILGEKVRKYSTESARVGRINQTVLIIATILEVMIALALVIQIMIGESQSFFQSITAGILVISCILNWGFYLREKASKYLRYSISTGFAIGYIYLVFTAKGDYVVAYVYPLLFATILYYDMKYTKIVVGFVGITNIIRIARLAMVGQNTDITNVLFAISILCCFGVYIITSLAKKFDEDVLGTVEDERLVQQRMVDDMLKTAEVLEDGTKETKELMKMLRNSSETVYGSMSEISESIQSNAENIQEQTSMTKNIQENIQETVGLSREMVEFSENTYQIVQNSVEIVEDMRKQSKVMEEQSKVIEQSMEQLEQKTREVANIADVIFSIANQTNLLALNASIESARAGEAGRGFAVVAEEIRQLAEQTRKSTENIETIIRELNVNAHNTMELTLTSIEATNKQNNLINMASDGFETISKNVEKLSNNVKKTEGRVEQLANANNIIVDNISQLSACSEEITASSQEARGLSEENMECAENADKLLEKIMEMVVILNKYREESN